METLESLFDHAIKEETKLSAKERVNLTANSPPFTVKRSSTVAALPAQLANMPRLDRQRLAPPGRSSDSYTDPTFPRDLTYKAWSQKVMEVCTEHKTCYKCKDQIHPGGHTDCPYQHLKRQAWGDFSPLHGKGPEAMQEDDPPGHNQEPARDSNPYAPQKGRSFGKSTFVPRGPGSASAQKRRFHG